MDPFEPLGVDLLSDIFRRLDFVELRDVRGTCRRFRQLVNRQDFAMEYKQHGAREVWHFTHTQSNENLLENWVMAVRDSDGVTMNFILNFDENDVEEEEIDVEEEEEDMSIDLICVSGTVLLFRNMSLGFKVFNIWTMQSRNIAYPLVGEMHLEHTVWGTRMITYPETQPHYIVAFFNRVIRGDVLRFHFFSNESRVGFQNFPHMAFSGEVDNLTMEEFKHPLGMVIADFFEGNLAFLSMRNNMPVYMMHSNVDFQDVFGHFEQSLQEFSPDFEEEGICFFCSEGYIVVVNIREVEIQGLWYGNIQRMTLGSLKDALEDGVPKIISVVPNELIPNDFAAFRLHRLMVVEEAVYFSFQCIAIQGHWDIVIFQYDIATGEWTRRRIARPEGQGMFGATIPASLGITPV
ncbi:hypothetical protein L1987_42367 [Smallanthus sonchifolius]|uniref:Uncharacterized protein n=1 Tax=Smallanthus sonchifolius TaxID=185202 RepID=A0ACB9GJU2_9ASTR|nr:hypothetical protein L1987_42367 [Smallanthus sonchifolius]